MLYCAGRPLSGSHPSPPCSFPASVLYQEAGANVVSLNWLESWQTASQRQGRGKGTHVLAVWRAGGGSLLGSLPARFQQRDHDSVGGTQRSHLQRG